MGVLSSPHHSPQHSPCVPSSQCSLLYPSAARRIPTPSDRCWLAALPVVLSLVSAIPGLELYLASLTLLSTNLWLDIPISTERGRLRLSLSLTLSDRSLPDITLLTLLPREEHTMLESLLTPLSLPVSTTVLSDIPDIILMSMARGRLRPSPSTVTPPELSLTCTTLLLSLLLLSDTLSP